MNSTVPFRHLDRPQPDISVNKFDDGSYIIESNISIGEYATNVATHLREAARDYPDRAFLVQCSPGDNWPVLTYAETRHKADQISSWLLSNGYGEDTPILILSSNSFAHALLTLGAIQVGVPIVPLSPSYSLMSEDFARLRYAAELVNAKMVFAENGDVYGKAIAALSDFNLKLVTNGGAAKDAMPFDDMLGEIDQTNVDAAFDQVTLDSLAKIMFTSGSTGMPKAVPNTQRMLCSGQKMMELISEPKDPENNPTVIVDWLPWHHTFGGNANFLSIIRSCGTLYMDDGKPIPGMFERTVENIRRAKPTRFSTVPTAFSFLLDRLEEDEELAQSFFENVRICSYGGAALSQELFERMQVLSIKYSGMRMPFGTGWGSTETTAMGTSVFWNEERVGLIGVPYSGSTVKLVPVGDKYEIRVKGPNVHTGYYGRPDLTDQYFDDEGFYCIGDAVDFIDPAQPEHGLVFKGRVSEDFKLANGTWVETGSLRLQLIDGLDPLARDIVIAGHDKEELTILIVPSEFVVKQATEAGYMQDGPLSLITDESILGQFKEKLLDFNKNNPGKSRQVARAVVMGFPLSADRNEITDKQYINQSAVLENRAQLVDRLYDGASGSEVIKLT